MRKSKLRNPKLKTIFYRLLSRVDAALAVKSTKLKLGKPELKLDRMRSKTISHRLLSRIYTALAVKFSKAEASLTRAQAR